ncbi:hypothetical protein BDW62DRAFT_204350 [Aspergillus aurantiobrunneus]
MSSETAQAPLSQPRTRPRAATDRAQTATTNSQSPRQSSQAVSPPTIAICRTPDAGSQSRLDKHVRARAASGPLRQPKPLSPSDIHSILEQEQEAMVNRLSRELTVLRHRTASVASTASSTSTTLNEPLDTIHGSPHLTGPIYPTASRRHRSSSSLSASYFPVFLGSRTNGRGRRPSLVSPERSQSLLSETSQPQAGKRDTSAHVAHKSHLYSHRNSVSQQRIPSGSSVSRSDETSPSRGNLESVLHENEVLRRRVQDLERHARDLELEISAQKRETYHLKD